MSGKPFQPGNPGGPGRPKGSSHSERCREWAAKRGFHLLERIAEGKEPGFQKRLNLRLEAIKYLIDRGYGKPTQEIITGQPDAGRQILMGVIDSIERAKERGLISYPDEEIPNEEKPIAAVRNPKLLGF